MVLKAGPKLDRLIASGVMGLVPCDEWESVNFGSAGGQALLKKCRHADGKCYSTGKIGSMSGSYDGVPSFSRSPVEAKRVIERMKELGFCSFDARGFFPPAFGTKDGWAVSFICNMGICKKHGTKFHNYHGAQKVEGQTFEEAICLAAIKAMESGSITRAAFKSGKGKA